MGIRLISLTGIFVLLTGCGGGGGRGSFEIPGVQLSLATSVDPVGTRSRSRAVYANLDQGAIVTILDYATGEELARGTLDANGRCDLRVTPGLTAAIVITGTRTVEGTPKPYRLSMLIPLVPQFDADYVVDPISSIAAEAIAGQHPVGTGTILCDEIVRGVVSKVEEYIAATSDSDFSIGGGVISGTVFGAAANLDSSKLADIIQEAAKPIDNNIAQAKNAVRQIRDAGIPIAMMLSQERPQIEEIYRTTQSKYSALIERIQTLIIPATLGRLSYNGSDGVRISDLTLGQAYSMEIVGGKRALTQIGPGTAGQIRIDYQTDGGVYTLAASKTGSYWTEIQTFTGDPAQEYRVTIPEIPANPGLNPSYSMTMSLTDSEFTTPLTFDGTISAQGGDLFYTTVVVTVEGTLSAPKFSCSARVQVTFPSQVPQNAKPGSEVYDYPSSASMSNTNISVTDGDNYTYRVTGQMSATTEIITSNGYALAVPKHIAIQGTYSDGRSGLEFSGSMTANWSNPAPDVNGMTAVGTFGMTGQFSREGYPTYSMGWDIGLNQGEITSQIELRSGTHILTGSATGTMVEHNPAYGTLTLRNQNNVELVLSSDAGGHISGAMTAGSPPAQVATFAKEGESLRITYSTDPVTFDEFPVW